MQLYEMQVNKTAIYRTAPARIPMGIIGAAVKLRFSPEWEGLTKTVVFRAGEVVKDILEVEDVAVIPAECTQEAGALLEIGVYGVDAENTVAIPTLWAAIGRVTEAADPSGDATTDPQLPVWAQLQAQIDELERQGVTQNEIEQAVRDFFGGERPTGKTTPEGGEIFNDYENNQALATHAKADGHGTIAASPCQHAQGKFNIPDTENQYAHIVGGGSSDDSRNNIYTLDWDGNAEFAGDVKVGPNREVLAKLREVAPAGFGLGGSCVDLPDESWNSAVFTGWYKAKFNAPTENTWFFGQVIRYINSNLVQRVWRQDASANDTRNFISAERRGFSSDGGETWLFEEWEWVDPPLLAGVEYRTMERHNGKPVYVKYLNFGALPNTSTANTKVAAPEPAIDVISMVGVAKSDKEVIDFPVARGGQWAAYAFVQYLETKTVLYVKTLSDMSAYKAEFIVKYTKN